MLYAVCSLVKTRGIKVTILAILNGIKWLFYKKILKKSYLEKKIHNYKMRLDLNDEGISKTLILFDTRELEHKIILQKILKEGMRIFDIGANIGYYANMELSITNGNCELLAIEPSPKNLSLLEHNLKINGFDNIKILQAAVSSSKGERDFYLSKQTNLNSFHKKGTGISYLSGEVIKVKTYSLVDLIEKYGSPDFIRMDVEGHEVDIINGLIPAIKEGKSSPKILLETHLTKYDKENDMVKTLKELFSLGYKVNMLASSSISGSNIIKKLGYKGGSPIITDDVQRVIFENIKNDDAIDLICKIGGVRAVLLSK